METKPRHAVKDSVFKNLFGDKKYLLQLYRALHPEDKEASEDDIKDVTIRPVFMDSEYNDLGFSIRDRLITLVESQSTWSPNIVVRALLYLADTYQDYLSRTNQNLYAGKKVALPAPELYVVYTGNKKNVPESISLCKEFFGGKKRAVDATVKILSDENEKTVIGEYIAFCKIYDEQRRLYGRVDKAIKEAIRICLDKDILREYLKEREREVIDIMGMLFSEEQLSRAYESEVARRVAERIERETAERVERETAARVERETAAKVERETAARVERETAAKVERETAAKVERETAEKMIAAGSLTVEEISAFSGLSVEEVEKLSGKGQRLN